MHQHKITRNVKKKWKKEERVVIGIHHAHTLRLRLCIPPGGCDADLASPLGSIVLDSESGRVTALSFPAGYAAGRMLQECGQVFFLLHARRASAITH